jgi:hypothetical protein
MGTDWHAVRDAFIAAGILAGIAIMLAVSLYGDSIPNKKYLFDIGIRCLRIAALPSVFPTMMV